MASSKLSVEVDLNKEETEAWIDVCTGNEEISIYVDDDGTVTIEESNTYLDVFLYILLFISILCVLFFLAMKIFKKESPVWARTSNTTDESMNIVAKTSNEDAEESIMKNKAE